MATPNLSITIKNANTLIWKLQSHKTDSEKLEAKYQHFIAEMIMLRLFSIFEEAVSEIAFKLAAGGTYTNGSVPILNIRSSSIAASRGLFLNYGRVRPETNLKWTKARYIKESVEYIMPSTERFIINAQNYGSIIEEMRKVRNMLAHNTHSARADYKCVIRQTYGANINISPGAYLTSTRRLPICNLNKYIASTRAIIAAMASGN